MFLSMVLHRRESFVPIRLLRDASILPSAAPVVSYHQIAKGVSSVTISGLNCTSHQFTATLQAEGAAQRQSGSFVCDARQLPSKMLLS